MNNNTIGWLFFRGYKNILPLMLTILPSYPCIPLKAIRYNISIALPRKCSLVLFRKTCIVIRNYEIMYVIFHDQRSFTIHTFELKKTETFRLLNDYYSIEEFAHAYSGTPIVRPPLLHPKSGLTRGVATCQG